MRVKVLILISVLYSVAHANTPVVTFEHDAIKVGEVIQLSLYYEHPKSEVVLFPDSTFDFSPFEYVSKTWSPTESDSSMSKDSVVYALRTFELKGPLSLSLPVFKLNGNDTLLLQSNNAFIKITNTIQELPDKALLKDDDGWVPTEKAFNYRLMWAIIGMVLVVLVALVLIFGRGVLALWRLRRLTKAHQQFLERFDELSAALQSSDPSKQKAEALVGSWKSHLQKLEKEPISTFTTKELVAFYPEENIKEVFAALDKFIYGGIKDESLTNELSNVKSLSEKVFQEKKSMLSRGK